VTGKRHLEGRREDANVRGGAIGRQHECRFRQVELQRERLHRLSSMPRASSKHGERIAGERVLGEYIDDAKRISGHGARSGSDARSVFGVELRARARETHRRTLRRARR
jgi:hypothetical protein